MIKLKDLDAKIELSTKAVNHFLTLKSYDSDNMLNHGMVLTRVYQNLYLDALNILNALYELKRNLYGDKDN